MPQELIDRFYMNFQVNLLQVWYEHVEEIIGLMANGQARGSEDIKLTDLLL